jgi:hypothetical protein
MIAQVIGQDDQDIRLFIGWLLCLQVNARNQEHEGEHGFCRDGIYFFPIVPGQRMNTVIGFQFCLEMFMVLLPNGVKQISSRITMPEN